MTTMTPPPDPSSIDFTGIAAWAGGVTAVLASIGAAIWAAVSKVSKIGTAAESPPAVHKTDVYTTDSIAMERLTGALDAANVLATEANALRREATEERRTLRAALDENTEATERSLAEIGELRTDVRDLSREIVRLHAVLEARRG
jgi:hypothetical protein